MGLHSFILHDGQIRRTASPELSAGQVGVLSGWGVFTTLRISSGFPFAWERHWPRLVRDAKLINLAMPEPDVVYEDLLRLVEANGHPECTLRLAIVRNTGSMWQSPEAARKPVSVIALTADSKAWSPAVRLGLQPHARFAGNEFAGAKLLSWAQNLTWAERAAAKGLDEVVLLNQHERVAECTSANVFCVHGRKVSTPPLSSGCLPGVTRAILLEEIEIPDIDIRERVLLQADLESADEVLITSTTREILPVTYIEGLPGAGLARGGHGVCESLRAAFRKNVDAYVSGHSRSMLGRNIPAI